MQDRARFQIEDDLAQIVLAGAQQGTRGAGYDSELRGALATALDAVLAAPVRGVVIRAGAGGWPVAADPASDYAQDPAVPDLGAIAERIATASVPVFVLLDGLVAGGALALAQAAQVRVARSGTRFAAPEFGLGLIPGAGGLVRLARRAGAAAAVEYVTGGHVVQAEAALRAGLCDRILDTASPAELLAIDGMPADAAIADPKAYMDGLDLWRARIPRGPLAPVAQRVCEVVEAALLLPATEAMVFENVACNDLASDELSLALRHVFYARRHAAQLAGVPAGGDAPQRVALWNPSDRLVLALLDQGIALQLGASDPLRIEAIRNVAAGTRRQVAGNGGRGLLPGADDLVTVSGIESFAPADLIVAAPRPGEIAALRARVPAGAALALETVRIQPGEFGFARLPGLAEVHAATPADTAGLNRLATVLRAERDIVVHAEGLATALEANFWLAAERAVMAGARPATVDAALTAWGFAEGPFARLDRRGLATAFAQFARVGVKAGAYLTWLGMEGRTGRAAGQGVWVYDGQVPRVWPDEAAELAALRSEAGILPAVLPAPEIITRVVAELARAGAALLQAGRVHRASDVDLVAIAGLGFPRHHGGPLFQADHIGLTIQRKRLRELAAQGASEPTTLWDVLIRNGRKFADLDR